MNLNPVKSALTTRKLLFIIIFFINVTVELQVEEEFQLRSHETMGLGGYHRNSCPKTYIGGGKEGRERRSLCPLLQSID